METDIQHLSIDSFIDFALAEDIGDGDQTTLATIPAGKKGKAIVRAKEDGIICGLNLARHIFKKVDPELQCSLLASDGASVKTGDIVIEVDGSVASILQAERLVLNFMQRMSGIATATKKFVDLVAGTGARILDTRKTTPNFRAFEKQAVLAGGGVNHRFGLYDMILIKDNHVDACGGIEAAILAAKDYLKRSGKNLKIEIETRTIAEVEQVLAAGGTDRILLDNFTLDKMREAVALIGGRIETEASGNMNEKTVREVALTGVNYISVGALTHSFRSLDISLTLLT